MTAGSDEIRAAPADKWESRPSLEFTELVASDPPTQEGRPSSPKRLPSRPAFAVRVCDARRARHPACDNLAGRPPTKVPETPCPPYGPRPEPRLREHATATVCVQPGPLMGGSTAPTPFGVPGPATRGASSLDGSPRGPASPFRIDELRRLPRPEIAAFVRVSSGSASLWSRARSSSRSVVGRPPCFRPPRSRSARTLAHRPPDSRLTANSLTRRDGRSQTESRSDPLLRREHASSQPPTRRVGVSSGIWTTRAQQRLVDRWGFRLRFRPQPELSRTISRGPAELSSCL